MENQEIMDQFLENRQNYMMDNNSSMQHMNVNVASAGCDAVVGVGIGGGVPGEVVSSGGVAGEILGVKYDEHHEEHDVGDDDELKYVKEVQQSEKQQQQQLQTLKNFGQEDNDNDDDVGTYERNELAEKETTNNAAYEFGNGDGGFVFGGDHHHHHQAQLQQQPHHDLFNMGNGHDTNGHEDFGNIVSSGFEEKLNMMDSEIDGFKTEGDFSSTSNVTESAEGFVPQVDVKIETKAEHQQQQEMVDEEEPSSLATNTTNGTSSLSENVPPQTAATEAAPQQANAFDEFMANLEDKENSDPLAPSRPTELDLDQGHSQLNPDAKEFIPSFGSNPASPTSPFATGMQNEPLLSDAMETQMYFGQAPTAVPRHLLGDDDFVAQSPRKGKSDNSMDTVSVPKLSEFEQEADKRPHELEPENVDSFQQRDEVMTPDQAIQQLPHDDLVGGQDKENCDPTDLTDFQPSSFIDHGPETCVDLDADLDIQAPVLNAEDDVMKRSMYVASDDAIEDVLNSVQPIPTEIDSVNNSFIEESATESAANQIAGDKELLQVEEKEHVSHSPSTEEIQMNLQNTLNSSNKDIPQLPVDMDNANNMQESMYMEQDQQQQQQFEDNQEQVKLYHEEEHQFEKEQMFQDQEQQPQVEEQQHFEQDLHLEQTQKHEEQQHFQDEFQQEKQPEPEHQLLQEDWTQHEIQNFNEEVQHEQQQQHFQEEEHHVEKHIEEEIQEQKLPEEQSTPEQYHHDELQIQDQPPQDLMADTQQTTIAANDESLLADTTNPLVATDSFLDNSHLDHEQQQEIHESYSPFKVDEVSAAPPVMDTLNLDVSESAEQNNLSDVVMSPSSSTADEKHLLEETKEQQQQELFSMSGLEQQMSEMILNNTDGHLSQAEEVAATTATTAIEDISENLISPEEAVHHEQFQQQQQEQEPIEEQMMVDDSFNRHEQECLLQHEQEQQQHEHELEQQRQHEPTFEKEIEQPQTAAEIPESIESPIEQHQQPELESEMVAVEEPIIEAKQATPLFTTEETEIVTKTEELIENKPEENLKIPFCMVPETAPAELLEPTMKQQNETETIMQDVKEDMVETEQKQIDELITSDAVKEPEPVVVEELKPQSEESAKPEVVETEPEVKTADIPVEAVAVAATAAAVAAKTASSPSKTKAEAAKKPLAKTTTAAAKPKVGTTTAAAKKPVEAAKKPVGLAAKPRTAPAKPAATPAEKKPIARTTTTTTTSARKPLSATSTTASKLMSKTTTTTSATRTATAASKPTTTTRPTTAPRTVSSTTTTAAARKPTTTNGPLAKPRPATAPAKPTTLGLPATNGAPKLKPTSPRSTLTSQVRKTTPSTTTAAKSPVKSSTATNGVAKTATTTLASRTKTTTSTVSSTAGKTFTARPAPKFTSSSSSTTTTTTTRRLTVGGTTTASTTTTTTKTSSTPLRKSSPTKPAPGRTPTKSTTAGGLKSKTSTTTKPASPPAKPAPIRKPVDKSAVTNGETNIAKELNGTAEKITAPAEEQQTSPQNGDLQAVQLEQQQQNGDSSIPMQTEEQQQQQQQQQQQSLLEPRDEQQIPMDLINA